MISKRVVTGIMAGMLVAMCGVAQARPYDWKTIPLQGGGFVDGFLYHPKKAGILYARTDVGGMYRYDYTHARWIPLMDGFGKDDWDCMGVMTMAVDPQKPERLYATCGLYLNDRAPNGAVVRSDDKGATWAITRLPFKLGGNAMGRGTGERLQVDPADSNTLWLGTNQDGLWVSHDQGKGFTRSAYAQKSVTTVLITGKTIYAGSGEVGEGLFKSSDGGRTFAPVAGSPKMIPHQMALGQDGTLYVTFSDNLGPHGVTDGAVWKLKGETWTDISPAKPSKEAPFGYSGLDLSPQGALVVSTSDRYSGSGDDLYISHDSGAHWTPVGPQAVHHVETHPWLVDYMGGNDPDAVARKHMGHWMDAVKINPFNPKELLYGTGYGVWMTGNLDALDSGEKVEFAFENNNFEETVILGLESPLAGPKVLMAAGDVGGTAFDDFSQTPSHGLFSPMNKTNQSVAFAALKPNIIVRSVDNETARGYISTDGAESWTAFNAPAPLATPDWHNHRAGKLAISAAGKAMVWVPEGEGAYHSNDLGQTWTLSTGWPKLERGQEAIADKVNDAVFYALDRGTGTVLVSRDGGVYFAPLYQLTAGQGQLRAVPGHEDDLWLAAGTALYHGEKAVAGVDAAWQVTFGKAAPGSDYPAVFLWGKVKGEEGLWRSDNAGADWVRINDDAHRFGQMRAIAGDPREYGTLYISPDGRGTMVGKP